MAIFFLAIVFQSEPFANSLSIAKTIGISMDLLLACVRYWIDQKFYYSTINSPGRLMLFIGYGLSHIVGIRRTNETTLVLAVLLCYFNQHTKCQPIEWFYRREMVRVQCTLGSIWQKYKEKKRERARGCVSLVIGCIGEFSHYAISTICDFVFCNET